MARIITGVVIGAVAGYLYYRLIGCRTGVCPIGQNPWSSAIFGALMGFVFATM